MRGGWAHQLRGEESRHSPAGLQVSWKSGTPGVAYHISIAQGETLSANYGGRNGSLQWGG
jgi:hypothetical protein